MKNNNVFTIKRNDTLPVISVQLKSRGNMDQVIPFDLSGVTAITFSMTDDCNNLKISSSPAQIGCSSGGSIQYSWVTGDTDEDGKFLGEFELFFDDGNKMSLPTLGGIEIIIAKDLNDA